MTVRLQVENYRALHKIDWELPKGVCGLVGPNGSGKTTLLDVPAMLRDFISRGVSKGFDLHGTVDGLRNLQAEANEPVRITMMSDTVQWTVELSTGPDNKHVTIDERVVHHGEVIFARSRNKRDDVVFSNLDDDSSGRLVGSDTVAIRVAESEEAKTSSNGDVAQLVKQMAGYRLYPPYDLEAVRRNPSAASADIDLDVSGHNIFSVLRNWHGKRDDKTRHDFVIEGLRDAFPDVFEHLDFEPTDKTVTGRIIMPRAPKSLPIRYAPSGLLTALLHLTAVASAPDGGIVAIDEPENGLHPYAIKRILAAMRDWADENDLTILLATHSPMLLDQFRDDPEHLYVMEPGRESLPVRLDQVRDRGWLAQFSLGDLYKAGDFGAPAEGAAA